MSKFGMIAMQNPTSQTARDPTTSRLAMAPLTFAGFLVAVVAVVVIAFLSYGSLKTTAASAESLTKTVEVLAQLQALLSTLKDAETGQRGYLLTGGRDSYLEPFTTAKQTLPAEFAAVRNLTAGNSVQQQRFAALQSLAEEKMQEMGETIELKRAGRPDAALDLVLTDRGKNTMDQIRNLVRDMEGSERQLIALRTAEWRTSATVAFGVTGGGSAVLLFLIAAAATMASREFRVRQLESWVG